MIIIFHILINKIVILKILFSVILTFKLTEN
ncbi:hypothetical protein Tresu_1734 [Treponema succinifaciens DSM 2489]|uniref:Uncharacterized protein n=1 Tax=Treponema succinifaciens (strain ATCC 33096 / DSM 2489 / 6091) TaxID=869209 RepID=F2NT34_TRES6|nr:hypothetical protein Tresu_1734 [Treponema succinifaciens DSM 2489]